MGFFQTSLISIGLAMDAFAVSVANGMALEDAKISHAFKFGIYFGVFQMGMALIGWWAGSSFASYIDGFAHWVAFILLTIIGVNMLIEGISKKNHNVTKCTNREILKFSNMLMLSVATSLDALAVGLGLAVININILYIGLSIGVFSFVLSVLGVMLGKTLSKAFQKGAEVVGGLILIGIGLKILLEHLL
ncbi:MAG: manganese efflux pump MntP family protein [Bacillota bacterium]